MTQKVFDTDNEEDMKLLWSILPDDVKRLKKNEPNVAYCVYVFSDSSCFINDMLKINWHDKTEITRPIQEVTEADLGKLCKFWDSNPDCYSFGIMTKILYSENAYYKDDWTLHKHCRRLTKQEIDELC